MPDQHNVLLLAGQNGSKSTFIGALYKHLYSDDSTTVTYRGVEGNVADEFEDGVIASMMKRKEYPGQTDEPYVVQLEFGGKSKFSKNITIDFIDIPGEQINDVLQPVLSDIKRGNINYDDEKKKYEQKVEPKFGGNQVISDDEWKTVFKHYYGQATKVIFLLNYYKLGNIGEDPTYDLNVLEQTAEDKVETALIATAVDLLSYDPDKNLKTNWRPGGQWKDKDLLTHMQKAINPAVSGRGATLLSNMDQSIQFDFFGVAVPADSAKSDNLSRDGGSFETRGFNNVKTWLKR